MNPQENIFDQDQAESSAHPLKHSLEALGSQEWEEIKMGLQESLIIAENEETPAFTDDVVYEWISSWGPRFNEFYQEMKTKKPELLVEWWEMHTDDPDQAIPELIRAWSEFKSQVH